MTTATITGPPRQLLAAADWPAISADLDASGCAVTPRLLSPAQCRDLAGLYDRPELFRSTIDMARHRFGSGQYRYFTHDLPDTVRALREAFYPHLLTVARSWAGCWPARPVARHPGGVAGHVPPRRAGQKLADPAQVPGRGLERPAPRPVRRR